MPEIPRLVIRQLLDAGYHPTTLSMVLGVPFDEVRGLMDSERAQVVAEDDALRDGMRILAWRTLEESMRILDEGTPQMKMQLIARFGGDMAKALAQEDAGHLAGLRAEFDELMSEVRGGPTVTDVEAFDDPDEQASASSA